MELNLVVRNIYFKEVTMPKSTGKKKGLDGKACWKGYRYAGTQKKGGKTVDKCVKAKKPKK